MENYNRTVCGCQSSERSNNCFGTVLTIIGILLTFVIGIIIGVALFPLFIVFFSAVITIAILLAVMFIVFLVMRLCSDSSSRC